MALVARRQLPLLLPTRIEASRVFLARGGQALPRSYAQALGEFAYRAHVTLRCKLGLAVHELVEFGIIVTGYPVHA